MILSRRRPERRGDHPRGQGLVELAIILPLLALLMVMALDFGRVFFGWVALHNAARIGADYASRQANAWTGSGDANIQDIYQQLVVNDLQGLNCEFTPPVPDPQFIDIDGNGISIDDGDHARVTLDCTFPLITPLAEQVLGGPVPMTASSQFSINRVIQPALPGGPDLPCSPPDPSFTFAPNNARSPVTVSFTDTSTTSGAECDITAWEWDFGDGSPTSTDQNPSHEYTCSTTPRCEYSANLTVTNDGGDATEFMTVRVRP